MSGGFAALDEVLHGIDAALAAGLAPVKINTVVERGVNDHTVLDLLEHFRGKPVIVRFIEFMDVGNRNAWRPEMVVPSRELADRINARWPIHPVSENYRGEVAKRWQLRRRRRGDRVHLLGFPAVLRGLFACAPVLGRKVLYLSFRNAWSRSARGDACRCLRR